MLVGERDLFHDEDQDLVHVVHDSGSDDRLD